MFTNIICRFPGICIDKMTFEEFAEIFEKIHKENEIKYNEEEEIMGFFKVGAIGFAYYLWRIWTAKELVSA